MTFDPTDDFAIRSGRADDIDAIYDLVVELAIYEREPEAVEPSRAQYHRDFADGLFQFLVASNGTQIIGTAIYYSAYSTWKGRMLFLEDFIVTERYRRQGCGARLFDAVLAEARKSNCRLVKWQVLDWNIPAIEFYKNYDINIEDNCLNGKLFL